MERNELISLVTRAQQGDCAAWSELFEKTADDFNYFALKLVRDEHIAEDVLQDAYVDMFLGVSSLKEPAAFIKWAKKIIYHFSFSFITIKNVGSVFLQAVCLQVRDFCSTAGSFP